MGVDTLAQLLERAFGGMAGLEALLGLLGGAAVVMRLRNYGCHVGGSTCFKSEGNRRHFVVKGVRVEVQWNLWDKASS